VATEGQTSVHRPPVPLPPNPTRPSSRPDETSRHKQKQTKKNIVSESGQVVGSNPSCRHVGSRHAKPYQKEQWVVIFWLHFGHKYLKKKKSKCGAGQVVYGARLLFCFCKNKDIIITTRGPQIHLLIFFSPTSPRQY
jgi:hypothetical protein